MRPLAGFLPALLLPQLPGRAVLGLNFAIHQATSVAKPNFSGLRCVRLAYLAQRVAGYCEPYQGAWPARGA